MTDLHVMLLGLDPYFLLKIYLTTDDLQFQDDDRSILMNLSEISVLISYAGHHDSPMVRRYDQISPQGEIIPIFV